MKRLDSSLKTAVLALFHPNSEGFGRKNFFWSFLIFLLFFAFTMDFQDRQKAAVIISPQPEAGFGLDLGREVRAIIGPNGAGKSSMLNVLNGVYHPQQGRITFKDKRFSDMDSHRAAALGIARTFQNIALFRGMTVLDNIMTGRNLKMR